MISRLFPWISMLGCSSLLLGCPSQQLITETPTVENADEQQATCKVAKDPLNPLIVEWPGTSKVDLDSSSQSGVVVVSYVGCTLKVLTSCKAGGNYDLTQVTPARDKVQIADQSELYARLPLGAASLKGELSLGSSLELDYIAVGQRVADKPPRTISGDCEGATHYIRTITVGAYSLDAKAKGKVGAGVEVANAGAGLGRSEEVRRLRGSGNVEECSKDPESSGCLAVLQLGLAPLAAKGGKLLDSANFGAGIGPLGEVPTVSEMADVTAVGAASLKNVDVDYLNMVQEARRAERNKTTRAKAKAVLWERVRDSRKTGEFVELATERAEEWREVAAAEERRREQLDKLRKGYVGDKSKLDQLLRMDEDLVSRDQKSAYQKEFNAAYEPFKAELAELGLVRGNAKVGGETAGGGNGSGGSKDVPEDLKDWAIGTPIGIEAELGYAVFGVATTAANAPSLGINPGDAEADSNVYVLGGNTFQIGANVGLPSLGAGFGLMAVVRAYIAEQTALTFGAQVRYTLPVGEQVGLEFAYQLGYGLFLDSRELTLTVPDQKVDTTANGMVMDIGLGLPITFDSFLLALRGGIGFNFMSATPVGGEGTAEVVSALESGLAGPHLTGSIGAAAGLRF